MYVREKLAELLQDENNPVWKWFPNNMAMMQLADYLIANGVTVQESCNTCAEATQNCIAELQEKIAELRSVQELDGCEYCNEDIDGYRKMIGAFSITNPFHGNVWNIETRHCKPRQIYFCPMCGRRLTKPPKGE